MAVPRDRRRCFWLARFDRSGRSAAAALDVRDLPSAWRRAERDARRGAFALYNDQGNLVRVGVAPPPAMDLPSPATAIALSRDGELLVTGHESGVVRAQSVTGGHVLWEHCAGAGRVESILLPSRAPYLIVCTRTGEVWVLKRDNGDVLLQLADDEARAIALAPDERTFALAGAVVELWALPEGIRTASLDVDVAAANQYRERDQGGDDGVGETSDDDGVYAVGFACGGEKIVGVRGRLGGELVLWDVHTGKRVASRAGCAVSRIAIAPDGRNALIGMHDPAAVVRRIDLSTLAIHSTYSTGAEALWDLRVTPDDRFAIAHDDEKGVYVVNMTDGVQHAWLDEYEACAYVVHSKRNGSSRSRASEGEVAEDTRVVALPRWGRGDPGAPLSDDGRRYAALRRSQDPGLVAVFDLRRCQPYAALSHPHPIVSVWLNRNGTRVATRDAHGQVYVWNVPDASDTLETERD